LLETSLLSRNQVVAIVDDDRPVREALADLLQVEGYPARTFEDGQSLLADALDQVACVITDVRMLGMNGLELQRRLRSHASSLPIIFITSSADKELQARAIAEGGLAWLSKPVSDVELLANLRSAPASPPTLRQRTEMSATAACAVNEDGARRDLEALGVPLLPSAADPAHTHMDPDTTAWWTLDVSGARGVMGQIVRGDRPPDWAARLLDHARIVEVSANSVHALAPYGTRRAMIGRPVSAYWPRESRRALAEVILAAAEGFPAGAPVSLPITSVAFDAARVNASTGLAEGLPDLVFVSAGGMVADGRSLWEVQVSERRYRNLTHHLPFALLQVDSTAMLPIFKQLRRGGVSDLSAYLDAVANLPIQSRSILRVTDANAAAVSLLGAQRIEQLIAPVDYLFAAAPETAKRVIHAHFEGRRCHSEVTKVRRFDGRLIDVELGVTYPTPPDRLEVTLITLVDVTERLRTEAQLRQLQADYTRAARISMLGELATSIAHEVNQPLSAIVTNAETSLRWMGREDPNLEKVKQLTGRIAESARNASAIVKRIRSMASRRPAESALLDLNEVVAEALMFVGHDFESRSIGLMLELEKGAPPVLGDRVQLLQVVVNLLINAQQAVAHAVGGGSIEVATRGAVAGSVTIAVRDNGPGIAEADLNRIFDSFFTTKHEGVGIGLALCQSIIAAHGGTLVAENRPRGGAAFSVTLPTAPAA
jgi:signal transduction histidine kinase/FixJ family two-component response regulator